MSLQYKFFIIPIVQLRESESELNHFLKTVRIITIHREFVVQGENSFWGVAVEYMSDGMSAGETKNTAKARKRVDYREVLSPEDFAVFAKLREWRKTAAENEGIPVYTIFTNEQLAVIAQKRITSRNGLKEIDGVGDARVKKYGDAAIGIVSESAKKNGKRAGR